MVVQLLSATENDDDNDSDSDGILSTMKCDTIQSNEEGDIESGCCPLQQQQNHESKQKHEQIDNNNDDDDLLSTTSPSSSSFNNMAIPPSAEHHQRYSERRARIFSALIVLVGVFSCSLFLGLGISFARQEQDEHFAGSTNELVQEIESAWNDYEMACLMLHYAATTQRSTLSKRDDDDVDYDDEHDMSTSSSFSSSQRVQFREVYEYLLSGGLDFQAAEFVPNVTHDEREELEQESKRYYALHFPNITYGGIQGFEPTFAGRNTTLSIQSRSVQPFYFPVHLLEPIGGNEAAIDLDLYSSESRRMTIESALDTWKPALSTRLTLVQEVDPSAYSVLLMHPGIPLSTKPNLRPRDLALLVIRIPALILRAADHVHAGSISVYIFDSTDDDSLFLGGAQIATTDDGSTTETTFLKETNLTNVRNSGRRFLERIVPIASRQWTIAVVAVDGTYEGDTTLVIVGAIMILVTCFSLALFVFSSMRRVNYMNKIRSQAEAEKSALLIESAKKQAESERELNDYIAHEIRNPLSAAMSAMSFVSSAVNAKQPLADEELQQSVREDTHIIQNSLKYVNDLLRSMLDMHRAANNQMKLDMKPTDVLKDVLEPVSSMLYRRGDEFEVILDCPKNFIVSTDRLRLTQVMLNLGRNACKFVIQGFIRLRASVVDGNVVVVIEDSGPGIPKEKRERLFNKFQDSLDSLSQGTGVGLCLCKHVIELMGGDINLDESYDSGIKDCPGTRFVINLNVPPLKLDLDSLETNKSMPQVHGDAPKEDERAVMEPTESLPEELSVLFVDDDLVLRKLFSRALKRIQPGWCIQEAASGETALELVDNEEFHLIFIDQYMASVEKQLLGTETTMALRAKGVQSTLCGLSANDMRASFMNAGADYFLLKPIPTEEDALRCELRRIVGVGRESRNGQQLSSARRVSPCRGRSNCCTADESNGRREFVSESCETGLFDR